MPVVLGHRVSARFLVLKFLSPFEVHVLNLSWQFALVNSLLLVLRHLRSIKRSFADILLAFPLHLLLSYDLLSLIECIPVDGGQLHIAGKNERLLTQLLPSSVLCTYHLLLRIDS